MLTAGCILACLIILALRIACHLQAAIGATGAAAFDLTAACSGFVMALVTGSQYIRAGTYKNVLVIGAQLQPCMGRNAAIVTAHALSGCSLQSSVVPPVRQHLQGPMEPAADDTACCHMQARMRCRATLTGGTAPPASCLATAVGQWCSQRGMAASAGCWAWTCTQVRLWLVSLQL